MFLGTLNAVHLPMTTTQTEWLASMGISAVWGPLGYEFSATVIGSSGTPLPLSVTPKGRFREGGPRFTFRMGPATSSHMTLRGALARMAAELAR